MRIKIGNSWVEMRPDLPIMVELSEQDKANIAFMDPEATKYAAYDEHSFTSEFIHAWMKDEAEISVVMPESFYDLYDPRLLHMAKDIFDGLLVDAPARKRQNSLLLLRNLMRISEIQAETIAYYADEKNYDDLARPIVQSPTGGTPECDEGDKARKAQDAVTAVINQNKWEARNG